MSETKSETASEIKSQVSDASTEVRSDTRATRGSEIEGLVFIGILVVALAYVWRKGDLAWVRPEDRA